MIEHGNDVGRVPVILHRKKAEQRLAAAGVRVAELTSSVALDAGSIPRTALADPLDRLLVSTARHLDAVFVTADRQILEYASETGNVRVHDASL